MLTLEHGNQSINLLKAIEQSICIILDLDLVVVSPNKKSSGHYNHRNMRDCKYLSLSAED